MSAARPAARRGLLPRVLESWWAPGRVVAGLRGMPEGAMVAVLLAALAIFLIAQAPGHARAAEIDPSVPLEARLIGAGVAVLFLMPLVAYAVAALVSLASRAVRHPITPADSRLALFWALLAIAPVMLLSGLVAGLIGPSPALTVTRAISGLGFLFIWGAGLRALAAR